MKALSNLPPGCTDADIERNAGAEPRKAAAFTSLCPRFLSARRAVAKKAGEPTDRGLDVLESVGRYYTVQDYEGKTVWAGSAHCRYCARVEAINALAKGDE